MKTLVIAEKPDMGRNIAAVIEPKAKNNRTYLEGERYIVTWAIGHLVGLAEPDLYDDKYKKWNFNDLPIIPERFLIVPNPKTKDQLKTIGQLAKRCDLIVNACDAGREGQYIFALIQQHLKLRQPVKRLWISDLTAETIRRGFAELRDGAEFDNLTRAARARSEADWLIGMNASRAFTTKHRTLLSVGRVQTPVLTLIYDRQKEIEAFESLTFYDCIAQFQQENTTYQGTWQGERITSQEQAQQLAAKVAGKPARIVNYEVKETKEYPYKLYDLTLLQRDANAKYGFSAKKTLDVAQALYEKHKVITYPRTNSNYVTEQNIDPMHKTLHMLKSTAYGPLAEGAERSRVHKNNKAVCNPAKVEDHHAILPTLKKAGALSADEQKVYDLIVRRFLAQFYPPAEYKQHALWTEVEQETFKTNVKELLLLGWKAVIEEQKPDKPKKPAAKKEAEEEEAEQLLLVPFQIDANAPTVCTEAVAKEKSTQPPKAYTEGTLLKAMESAGKQMENEELREAMKDAGLGTPATRAATIERLKQVGYITMQGKRITVTQKGRTAVELIRHAGIDLLTSPEMTGQWERRLHQISKGEASNERFMENVIKFTTLIIDKVKYQRPAAKEAFAEGETDVSRKKSGSAKGTRTQRRSKDDGERHAAAVSGAQGDTATDKRSEEPAHFGDCPRPGCGGRIIMGRKGYGCNRYREGCKFVIWKESFGKPLTETMIKSLLQKGVTQALTFKEGDGSSYKAKLRIADPNTGELALERQE
ncbi:MULTISPECIES: type IA DNA topoisomerase [unclassified Paenibacillus]|uniref:type IA DNA topoisomerase n=1 Tax=unclassified Paenibacillus TaxID=185978 RepID=UPI001C10A7D7|nr:MULTISPECIES: type IA DNA topoisomerase [unclassified Paenibacillus]MBU5443189.1 DNA topoisomerase 3 [Paenibacillus sp. MSJ-34]CAH0121410.1 DNA topoisomerase 3 [Paenibacillus sp. CECT 9249]